MDFKRVHGGIGSGEGVIYNVRDQILKGEKLIDEGETDKRLLLLESEFAQVLAVAKREGSTVSEVLRRAWDGTTLQTLTRHNSIRATGAFVSLIGHITIDELLRHLNKTEIVNGLMNRFLFVCVRRSKQLPDGGSLEEAQLEPLITRLRTVVSSAKDIGEMKRDGEATRLWHEVYRELSGPQPGLFGAVISRGEAQVLRLSMLYALLDSSAIIRRVHLLAALSVWEYVEASAKRIFGDSLGDKNADVILNALRRTQVGLARTEISALFARNRTETEIATALSLLTEFGLAHWQREESGGRPGERWLETKQTN